MRKGPTPDLDTLAARVNMLPYPKTVVDQGWLYGMWYCSTSWQKAIYYGQFPATLVRRVTTMFPPSDFRFLHLCCGRAAIAGATNVDNQPLPEADVVADVTALPFADASYDVAFIDPPYSDLDAVRYKQPRLVPSGKVMAEAYRVLVPGGWLLWLDEKYPAYRRATWTLRGLIGVVLGFERRTRCLSMFQR